MIILGSLVWMTNNYITYEIPFVSSWTYPNNVNDVNEREKKYGYILNICFVDVNVNVR